MISRHNRRLWFALILVAAILSVYGYKLFVHNFYSLQLNPDGRAIANAVNVSFGENAYFPGNPEFEARLNLYRAGCVNRQPDHPDRCELASSAGDVSTYYSKCHWWRFERCAHIKADPALISSDQIKQDLLAVLADPCAFLPLVAGIEAVEARANETGYVHTSITEFRHHLHDLRCSAGPKVDLKTIVTFPGGGGKKTIVTYSKIGRP